MESFQTMDFPFYGSQQRPKPYFGNVGNHIQREEERKPATRNRKVVQIPVRFVGAEPEPDSSKFASKIQKVFRGFLVRKSVRKIMAIKKETDEIDARISRSEEVELLEKDRKERLKVNEMLMALLLKLDSVRGVGSGVRDCRKSVIRKVIALQERVDAIATAAAASSSADVGSVEPQSEALAEEKDDKPEYQVLEKDDKPEHQVLEINDVAAAVAAGNSVRKVDSSDDHSPQNNDDDVYFENKGSVQGTEECNNEGGADKEPWCEVKCSDHLMNYEESGAQNCDREYNVGANSQMNAEVDNSVEGVEKEVGIDSEVKVDMEPCLDKIMLLDNTKNKNSGEIQEVGFLVEDNQEDMCERTPALSECMEESMETSQMEDAKGGEEEKNEGRNYEGDDVKTNRELLERMMKENEKMMKLMTQLYERNEMQTRMLNRLTHRVEQLEKAFVCDIMRRKKKNRQSA